MSGNGSEMQHDGSGNTVDDTKLIIGGLSWDTNEYGLTKYFESFGLVRDCVVKRDPSSSRSLGFGNIQFEDSSSIDKVLSQRVHLLDGRQISANRANKATDNLWNPKYGPAPDYGGYDDGKRYGYGGSSSGHGESGANSGYGNYRPGGDFSQMQFSVGGQGAAADQQNSGDKTKSAGRSN